MDSQTGIFNRAKLAYSKGSNRLAQRVKQAVRDCDIHEHRICWLQRQTDRETDRQATQTDNQTDKTRIGPSRRADRSSLKQ